MASQEEDAFSIRIVSLDYYMSPPIPDLDFCYSSFQGTKVEEVPVVRIYGATPAGQKTCLHVHRALPYFYVPFPEDISQSPEEGQAFIRILSSAIENTLRLRSFSTSKRQHVYGCSLVKAKKLYGYHSSEELFAKIFLYHPHDITLTARLLLDGSVLGKSLQPYESHIPYLLQFLVDYNLYGMSHIHASKVKFRSPLVYCYNGTSLRPRNILETLDSNTCEKPKDWLSSTVSSTVVWPDFTGSLDSLGNEYAQLIKRQSICQLEADASVEDIVNEKFKIYTSLSQARLDLRMVQSLLPIWEEEYERSGIQEATKQDNSNKLHPDRVLRCFLHGHNYDKTLSELCMKFERMRDQSCAKSCDFSLTCGDTKNRSREALSSQSLNKKDLEDNDALQLLYWLASSQAEDEMVTGDELLHEAILSPLMPVNPYSMALEIAYRDYEHASQLECQDILDSVESILKLERSEGEASSFLQDHTLNSFDIKSEGSKEHNLSSSQDILDSVSSGACNFQVHVSIDENSKTPQKGNSLEARISYGVEKAITQPGGIGPMVSSQSKEKKPLGDLPFCPSRSEYGASESSCAASFSQDEMIDKGFYNPQFHNAEFIQNYGLKTEFGSEICSKNGGMASGLRSTRDLMRKRRSIRVEQAEAEVQIDEVVPYMFKERPTASVGEGLQLFIEEPLIGHSAILQSVKGTACSTTVCSDIHRREYVEDQTPACRICTIQNTLSSLCTNKMQSNIVPSDITVVNQRTHLNEQLKNSIVSLNLPVGNLSVLETVPQKMLEVSEVKAVGSLSRAFFCRQHRDERPGFLPTLNKCQFKHSANCTGNNALKSIRYKRWNSDFSENNNNNDPDGSILHETPIPKMPHNGFQLSTCLSDENCRDFCKEISHEIIEMTFISKPPSNGHILGPDESLPVDQTDGNIVKIQGTKHVLPFFPRIFQDANTYDKSIFINEDSALGVPIHFQNDGSVLYLLTHAQSPPTLITVCDWLSVQQKHCLLEETAVDWSQYDSSQSNKQKYSPESKNIYPNIGHISSEAKLDIIPEKVEVLTKSLHDLSQISGPEKYENSNPTPLSQIGFRDSASVGGEQQLTLISLELLAESRDDLRPNPKFDAIKILSLVVQEDTSTASQVYVLIHVINEKSSEINGIGVPDCRMFLFTEEKLLLKQFIDIISYVDPDILMGWETHGCSLGYLTERAVYLGMNIPEKISRTPFHEKRGITMDLLHSNSFDAFPEATVAKTVLENSVIEDEWASAHASSLQVGGRIVLNIWRLMRSELKLNMYTAEAVAEVVLRQKIPLFSNRTLNQWYSSGIGRARDKCIRYIIERSILNIHIMNQLDMINRTSQLARIFGIDFSSVISRGSQFRVESMLLRLAHTQNYLAISPGYQQVASQPAMECLPLVMEPESGFYSDPVVVLDFQSLYPSMIIAYNLCFCTCLGNVLTASSNTLGVSSYSPDLQILKDFREKLRLTPNGVLYVPPEVRKGLLPRLLEEILSTRIMVKQAMKKLKSSQLVLHKILNARQLALKLISNVTYGYTAAGFSGRMPCAEIADSIVQCGRRTLETAISFVNQHEKWNAKVIYGDTDSMFVLLKGRSKEDAFIIGNEIASVITSMNPEPVALKMEKVYQPCFLLTKKRYVGYSYMNPEQEKPAFDAKGIETVRRDTCPAVAKILERSIRLFFESKNLAEVRSYVERQWTRILSGKISLKDFVFAKEVRLGTYSKASSLPPAAVVAKKATGIDPRARPHYGERVPYVVVHGEPGSHLIDMVINPLELLNLNSPFRLNDLYYINKQIIPALQRVFCFFGADMHQWFSAVPRPTRPMLTKCNAPMLVSKSFNDDNKGDPSVAKKPQAKRIRIDAYYSLKHCYLCDGDLIQSSEPFCVKCLNKMSLVAAAVSGRTSKREKEIQHLNEICRHCGGGDWIVENGVKCISLTCSVTYERQKVLKELQFHSSFSTNAGFYPSCNVELF